MDLLQIINKTGWDWRIGKRTIKISAPDQDAADDLLDKWLENLAQSAANVGGFVDIDWGGDLVYRITPNMAVQSRPKNSAYKAGDESMTNDHQSEDPNNDQVDRQIDYDPSLLLVIPELELNQSLLVDVTRPTYITRIFDQENLYANAAALAAQGQKPRFIGMTAYTLNNPDELERRCDLLMNSEILREYEYKAWRWFFDVDANRWSLKELYFVSNFRRLDRINLGQYLQVRDEPLWLGQVLRTDELVSR